MSWWTESWTAFRVVRSSDRRHVLLRLAGELDRAAAPRARRELATATHRPLIVVDLAEVTFIDAAGIGVLANAARRMADRGGRLVLTSPRRTVRRVLEITHLDAHVALHETVDGALAWAERTSLFAVR